MILRQTSAPFFHRTQDELFGSNRSTPASLCLELPCRPGTTVNTVTLDYLHSLLLLEDKLTDSFPECEQVLGERETDIALGEALGPPSLFFEFLPFAVLYGIILITGVSGSAVSSVVCRTF